MSLFKRLTTFLSVASLLVATLVINPIDVFAYSFKSTAFRGNTSVSLVYSGAVKGYNIDQYMVDMNKRFAYRFVGGLIQIGGATKWGNAKQVLSEFQTKFNLPQTDGVITPKDIETLDVLLAEQEVKNQENIKKVLKAYPNLKIDLDAANCSHEPLMYYFGKLADTINVFSDKQRSLLKSFRIQCNLNQARGLGGNGKIILNVGKAISGDKFIATFIHEMGHVIDAEAGIRSSGGKVYSNNSKYATGGNERNLLGATAFSDSKEIVYTSKPTVKFYSISWDGYHQKDEKSKRQDFITGYGATDHFEEFAEGVVTYVVHGKNFKHTAATNDAFKGKYEYIKKNVFQGKEFNTGEDKELPLMWDGTEPLYSKNFSPLILE